MVQMMQGALSAAAGKAAPAGSDWASAIASALGGLGPQDNPMLDAMRQAAGEGARGFEHLFADFAAAAAPLRQEFQALMHLPAFGYARESQERLQRFALALDEYRVQLEHYNRLLADASRRALEKFEAKLAEHSEPGRQLKSFRALYDLWIDAAEEGYAEVALSSEFRQVYGALVNAQMAVRRHVQQEVERSAAALGMPTRTELDAVHRKLAAMKRRIAELEHAGARAAVGAATPADAGQPDAARRRAATRSGRAKPSPAPPSARVHQAPKRTKAAASRAAAPRIAVEGAGKPAPTRRAKAPPGSFAERLAAARRALRKPGQGGR
jgi:hypothetical protein